MLKLKPVLRQLSFASLLLMLGAIAGWRLSLNNHRTSENAELIPSVESEVTKPRKVLYWYDPMMPEQHFAQPGKSPFMDMELIAKYTDAETAAPGIKIDPQLAENIGMRLTYVSRIPFSRSVEVSGLLTFNEHDVAVIQALSNGFVKQVRPLAVGDMVAARQVLAELVYPEWVAAQQELLAVQHLGDLDLIQAAQERLQLLGMPMPLIQELLHTGEVKRSYVLTAPLSGVIQSLELRNGMSISTGQTITRINGFDRVWLEAAVPEALAGGIRPGDYAEIRLAADPGRLLKAKVAAVIPFLNENSRTLKIRIELHNDNQQLRPGQTAQVKLITAGTNTVLVIPTEAIIRTGKRALVMLAGHEGRYLPQEISPGPEIGDKTVISAGLDEGQQIVASGQFLIDSEASLNGVNIKSLPVESAIPAGTP